MGALKYPEVRKLIGPVVPGTVVPKGTSVFGTPHVLDPIRGAFSIGTIIRWLDFNDCWLAAEWGHPSDNLGAILAVTDYLNRNGADFRIKDVLKAMIQAHEIQGVLALENSFNSVGLDHVVLVKVASAAVVSKLMGLTEEQTEYAISHAFVDGQSLRTYRHYPNTMSRKSWAAGDACLRAVNLVYHVKNGVTGIPSVLTAPTWGFYDVLFKGKEFKMQRDFGTYVMENVLFKISFPAEFHAQTAVEAALKVKLKLDEAGKTHKDIKKITIHTQEAAIRIIDKKGPLNNYADRDHCIQYMVAVPLIHGSLVADHYHDKTAANPEIDALRETMTCVEHKDFSVDYLDPEKRSIGNALEVELKDGTKLYEAVEYPVGHRRRREEGTPLLLQKFHNHLAEFYGEGSEKVSEIERIVSSDEFENMRVEEFVDVVGPSA